jgi:hypothetical protein
MSDQFGNSVFSHLSLPEEMLELQCMSVEFIMKYLNEKGYKIQHITGKSCLHFYALASFM